MVQIRTKSTRAAEGLDGADAAGEHGFGIGAEDELLDGAAVGRNAGHRHIAVVSSSFKKTAVSFCDGLHQRELPFLVQEDADTEIDLFCPCILLEKLIEAEDGIIGGGLQ